MDINLINSFMEVTNSTRDEAEFFLNASNNDLPTAITNFYNRDSSHDQPAVQQPLITQPQQRQQPQATPTATTWAKKPTTTTTRRSGMVTFNDLNRGDDTGGSPDDDQNANRYYAGGSTTSGQQIIGRDDENRRQQGTAYANDLASQILKRAQEVAERGGVGASTGAATTSGGDFDRPSSSSSSSFAGSGYRLGELDDAAEPSQSSSSQRQASQASQASQSQQQGGEEEKTVTITFYQDGFTIDDGELRKFDDPANQKFLESINKGVVPQEVAGMAKEVLVNLVSKREEKYADQKKQFKAFGGEGRSLGAARTVSSSSSSSTASSMASSASSSSATSTPPPSYSVDKNRPHTTIQIRLHDGTRLNATFNLDDTVKTLIQFVQASRPNVGNFQLMIPFPRKVLDNPNLTIEQAGLKNAAIVQNLI